MRAVAPRPDASQVSFSVVLARRLHPIECGYLIAPGCTIKTTALAPAPTPATVSVKLEYVPHEQAGQNFIAVAEASFAHYKETGLHITLDEYRGWVDAAQQDADSAVPECHR